MSVSAYPLHWPAGRERSTRQKPSRFSVTTGKARDELVKEIRRLGGTDPILSTNIKLRLDGLPYASVKEPDDTGVAVYFMYRGTQHCFACDKWDSVGDNLHAVRKTIEALRGIARWGTGDMMERAFDGFAKIEHKPEYARPWHAVLGCPEDASPQEAERAYRRAVARTHPDRAGGSSDAYMEVRLAWEQARQKRHV